MDKKFIKVRNVLIFLVVVICLTAGLFFGLTIIKQTENEAYKGFDDILRQFKRSENTRIEKLTEITNYMSNVAAEIAAYHEEANSFLPSLHTMEDIKASLGASMSTNKISSITVVTLGPEEVVIIATLTGIDSEIDGKTFTLTGSPSKEYGLLWIWAGTVPSVYLPKGK
jgi:methanogenic corrinoid protein MtbC1